LAAIGVKNRTLAPTAFVGGRIGRFCFLAAVRAGGRNGWFCQSQIPANRFPIESQFPGNASLESEDNPGRFGVF
jgi:hypothetical protein